MSSDLRRPLLSEVEPDALPVVTTAELVSPGRPLDSGTVVVTGTLVAEGAAALSTGDNFVAEDDLVTPRAARVATQPPPARRPPLLARPWWQCIVDWCWSRWECVGDCSDALSEDCIRGRCCGYRAHVYSAKLMMACAGCGMVGALCISCALLVSAVKLAAYEEPLNRHGELGGMHPSPLPCTVVAVYHRNVVMRHLVHQHHPHHPHHPHNPHGHSPHGHSPSSGRRLVGLPLVDPRRDTDTDTDTAANTGTAYARHRHHPMHSPPPPHSTPPPHSPPPPRRHVHSPPPPRHHMHHPHHPAPSADAPRWRAAGPLLGPEEAWASASAHPEDDRSPDQRSRRSPDQRGLHSTADGVDHGFWDSAASHCFDRWLIAFRHFSANATEQPAAAGEPLAVTRARLLARGWREVSSVGTATSDWNETQPDVILSPPLHTARACDFDYHATSGPRLFSRRASDASYGTSSYLQPAEVAYAEPARDLGCGRSSKVDGGGGGGGGGGGSGGGGAWWDDDGGVAAWVTNPWRPQILDRASLQVVDRDAPPFVLWQFGGSVGAPSAWQLSQLDVDAILCTKEWTGPPSLRPDPPACTLKGDGPVSRVLSRAVTDGCGDWPTPNEWRTNCPLTAGSHLPCWTLGSDAATAEDASRYHGCRSTRRAGEQRGKYGVNGRAAPTTLSEVADALAGEGPPNPRCSTIVPPSWRVRDWYVATWVTSLESYDPWSTLNLGFWCVGMAVLCMVIECFIQLYGHGSPSIVCSGLVCTLHLALLVLVIVLIRK